MMALDEEQRYVVEEDKSICVVAGPGSGKTRVLTEKARSLFNKGEKILCLCFTRSAAREMASRVQGLPACTIHSYCCGRVGWDEKWGYSGLLYRFLAESKDDKYQWVLVDEVQDLNEMEMDVVLTLIGNKVFAVGDPYQSIYGFQGAMGPKVVDLFKRIGCKKVNLHNNYRSCPKVVDKLNRIFDRRLVSRNVKDTGLTCVLCRTNDDVFYISNYLKNAIIPHKVRLASDISTSREYDVVGESNLRVMTIHQSKGHEFDKVILFDWFPNELGEEERVYYVACARTSKEFIEVSNLEELSKCLK